MRHRILSALSAAICLSWILLVVSAPFVHAGSYGFPQKAEDAASASGDNLMPIAAVRKDGNDTALTGTDGDYTHLSANDVGNLKVQVEHSRKPTYMVTCAPVARASSATDMFIFNGSSSKVVKILRLIITYHTSSGAANNFYLIKRSAANSGGTSTLSTGISLDSSDSATTATGLRDYTANPSSLGTAVGTLQIATIAGGVAAQGNVPIDANVAVFDARQFGKPITLRGTAEGIAINNNGSTVGGSTPVVGCTVLYTEE